MATRASRGSKRRQGTSGGTRGTSRSRGSAGKRPTARSTRRPDPVERVLLAAGRLLVRAWLLMAHGLGGAVRALGHSARDLDPQHRRDGLGLVVLGIGIVTAAAVWWRLPGEAGTIIEGVVRVTFGSLAVAVPFLMGLLAWRLLRHPDRNAETARVVVGWGALLTGVLGLVHLARPTPFPDPGIEPLERAGGWVGFVAAGPLAHLLTTWVTAPLLVLLSAFGMLVVTGTPVHRIPERLAEGRDRLLRRPAGGGSDGAAGDGAGDGPGDGPGGSAAPKKLARRRAARSAVRDVEIGDRTRPYDSPVLSDGEGDAKAVGGSQPAPTTPGDTPRTTRSRPTRRRSPRGRNSSPLRRPVGGTTRCRHRRCCAPGRRRRRAPGPTRRSWRR